MATMELDQTSRSTSIIAGTDDQLQVVRANAGVTRAAARKLALATARRPVSQLANPRWLICF